MRVFITGGSGFVGGHLIEALASEHEVLAMARSDASAAKVEILGAKSILTDLETVGAPDLEGVDVVIHAAAFVEEWGPESVYFDINVGGTTRVLDAAKTAGVERFILVSTNTTVFDGLGQRGVDETSAYPEHQSFPYGASKAEAERLVLAADGDGFTTLALRPCFVWGPRDTTLLPALRRMAHEGSFVWLDGGRAVVSTTHVANLVHGIQCALTQGEGGQAYFIADDGDVAVKDFLTGLAEGEGIALRSWSVPGALVRGIASVLEGTYRSFGWSQTPPVTRLAAALMSRDMTVQTGKARAELGWTPVVSRADGFRSLGA